MNIQNNVSLKSYNTFGIDAVAKAFTTFESEDALREALDYVRSSGLRPLVLGGGSNLLFTGDYEGIVLKNGLRGIEVTAEDEDHVYLRAAAGENWHRFVMYCVEHEYAGLENLSLIPGCVGASPMQNIGAYGVEIRDCFHELEAIHIADGGSHRFNAADCAFGYRESVFKRKYRNQFVITRVTYRLNKKPSFHISYGAVAQELERMGVEQLSIRAVSEAVIHIRQSKLPDPAEIGNAGSFFKNPAVRQTALQRLQKEYPEIPFYTIDDTTVKIPAGWLIEQLGWKGYREGDAGCHSKQALVLVNFGQASGKDIYRLSERIVESVKNKFGIELEREVNII